MNRAFLSHSSKQKKLVSQIASNLGKQKCVYDDYEFEAGMPILDEILKGLSNTELFVLFISNDSLDSIWVQKEITETERILDKNLNNHFYPILIDNSISASDKRIPDWVKKYLLKPMTDPFLITKKINQKLRELSIERNPLFKAKESLFVGRNSAFETLEAKMFSITDVKPSSIIVSGFDGIGRRTFLKMALKRFGKINEFYDPIYIALSTKDSIEDFILKLQDFEKENTDEFLIHLKDISFEEKIELAKQTLVKVQKSNEYVFIIDSGCIVHPSMKVANWYLNIIADKRFKNLFTLNIISRFRPSNGLLKINKNLINFHLTSLSDSDTEKLFVKYSNLFNLDLKTDNAKEILGILNGIPSQVHYSVEYIANYGIVDALKNKNEIIDFGETEVYYLIDLVKAKGELAYNLLILMSSFEFVSYDLLYSIIDERDSVEKLLEDFYIIGVFDLVGANKEYIKVHYPIVDYIKRSKSKLDKKHSSKLRENIKSFISKSDDEMEYGDISQLLFNIKGAILAGHKLPDRYYIPSFVLKTIVELYYEGNYKNVISLIDKMLENSKRLDESLVREFNYWLCLCLARKSSSRFETAVETMDGADYNYLYGFYYRFKKDYGKSENNLNRALEKYPNFQRARRELVNILLLKEDYSKALELAKANYQNQKLNAFHIQAYFICLIRKQYLTKEDKIVIEELFKNIERSYDTKAKEIGNVMKGEYAFYIKKDNASAIQILRECIKTNSSKHYAVKALQDIYEKCSLHQPLNELNSKFEKRIYTFSN